LLALGASSLAQLWKPDLAARIVNSDSDVRRRAYREVLEQREQTIQQALAVLQEEGVDKRMNGRLHLAIDLLGAFRASEAVEPLIKLLTYIPDGFYQHEDLPPQAHHPATLALRDIGVPALEPLVGRIQSTGSDQERRLAAFAIMLVEGAEHGAFRLRKAKADSKVASERLEKASRFVETYHFRELLQLKLIRATGEFQEYSARFESRGRGGTAVFTYRIGRSMELKPGEVAELALVAESGDVLKDIGDRLQRAVVTVQSGSEFVAPATLSLPVDEMTNTTLTVRLRLLDPATDCPKAIEVAIEE
jgi:hypothetical protein